MTAPVQKEEPESSGSEDTASCGGRLHRRHQRYDQEAALRRHTDMLQVWQMGHIASQPRWHVSQRDSLKLPGLLWHSTSVARFPDGSVSLSATKAMAGHRCYSMPSIPEHLDGTTVVGVGT